MVNRVTWWLMRTTLPPVVRRVEARPKTWAAGVFVAASLVMFAAFYTAPRHSDAPSGGNALHGELWPAALAAVLFALFAFLLAFTFVKRKSPRA